MTTNVGLAIAKLWAARAPVPVPCPTCGVKPLVELVRHGFRKDVRIAVVLCENLDCATQTIFLGGDGDVAAIVNAWNDDAGRAKGVGGSKEMARKSLDTSGAPGTI